MFTPSLWHYLLREWIEPISVAIVLALFIKRIIFEIYVIPTSSMEPTLHGNGHYPEDGGDKVLVNKFVYHFTDPKNWDVIVFDPPAGNHLYIKRLIGLPNQTIQIVDGDIFLNGKILRKPADIEDSMLNTVYNSSVKSNLDHFVDFQKEPWSISENWRISENSFTINKSSGNLIFELPIDMRIESHKPSKMQMDSGLYDYQVKSGLSWHQHSEADFISLKVGDIQVSGKILLKDIEGSWQIVIQENEDNFKLILNIKEKKVEVYRNDNKVWTGPIELSKDNWYDFSFSNIDDKLSGKIDGVIFDYPFENENLALSTEKNGFQFQAIGCSLEMKDIVVRRDINYLKAEEKTLFSSMETVKGSKSENLYSTFKPGDDDYLCFGDNVLDSLDSRYWGFAKGSKIKGQAMYVLMPIRIWPGDDLPPQIPLLTHRTRFKKIR
jgi:signal peptidase I